MPLPAALLERLKRRRIIKEAQPRSSPCPSSSADEEESSTAKQRYQIHHREQVADNDEEQEEIIAEDYDDEEEETTDGQSINNPANSAEKPTTCSGEECAESETAQVPFCQTRNDNHDIDDGSAQEHRLDLVRAPGNDDDGKEEKDISDIILGYKSVLGCPNKYNIYHECSRYCIERYSDINPQPTIEQRKLLAIILKTYPLTNDWTVVYDPGVRTFYFWNIITNLVSWLPPSMNGLVSVSADQIRRTLKEMGQTN